MAPGEDEVRTLSSCERSRPEGFSSYLLTLQETATKRAADVFLVSAYAPTSAHSEDDWDAYYDSLLAALARCPPKAIAIIGSDANACIGTGEGERNDEKFDEGY